MRTNLHYITEEDGRSLHVQDGVVTPSSLPKPLPNAPAGANDIVISWERQANRYGIQRQFTTPIQYVLDGAKIIRNAYYSQGYERKLYHLIQRLKTDVAETTFKQRYEYLYRGEIDLSTFSNEGTFVTCKIMEGDLDKILRAKENTVYEIPFDADAVMIKINGIPIFSKTTFISTEIDVLTNVATYCLAWLPIQFVNREGTIVNGVSFSQNLITFDSNTDHDDNRNNDNYFFEATDDITIKVKIPELTGILNNGLRGDLYIRNSNGGRTEIAKVDSDNPAGTTGFTKSQLFPEQVIELSLNKGEKLYLISQCTDSSLIAGGASISWSEFQPEIEIESTYRTTYIKAFKPYILFRKLIEKITGSADYAQSILLQSEENFLITSGDAIRGIDGSVIKTSLNDFYEHCNVLHFSGQQIENGKILIENRSRFFDASDPIHLGSVKNFKSGLATDLIGNRIKIGWPQPDVDDVNGKYSINGSHIYESIITRISKETVIQSPYSTDPYEIEITRINLDGKTTTDNQADNKVYCINAIGQPIEYAENQVSFAQFGDMQAMIILGATIQLEPGMKFTTSQINNPGPFTVRSVIEILGNITVFVNESITPASSAPVVITIVSGQLHILNRPDYDSITGVPTNQIFNVEGMTPKRLLLKHGPWLRSVFYPFDNTSLNFTTSERNKDLVTTIGGVTIEEKANQSISAFGAKLFIPEYFEFETEVPTDIIALLEENPNRCFSFEWEGNIYKGFNVKVSIAINTDESQSFKLLSAPDVDLTKLI